METSTPRLSHPTNRDPDLSRSDTYTRYLEAAIDSDGPLNRYRELLPYLKSKDVPSLRSAETTSLLRINNGQCRQWHLNDAYSLKKTFEEEQEPWQYQVLLVRQGSIYTEPSVIEVVSLELDIPPTIWFLILSGSRNISNIGIIPDTPNASLERQHILHVGNQWLLLVNPLTRSQPQTGSIFFQSGWRKGSSLFIAIVLLDEKDVSIPVLTRKKDYMRFPGMPKYRIFDQYGSLASRPSATEPKTNRDADNYNLSNRSHSYIAFHRWKYAITRFVSERIEDVGQYGDGNFLLVCVEALLSIQSCNPPWCISLIDHENGDSWGRYTGERLFEDSHQQRWAELRDELDSHRETLLWLAYFIKTNFNLEETKAKIACSGLQGNFERFVKEVEIAEVRSRDQIGILSSRKATEMAQMSIAESKRVMIRESDRIMILLNSALADGEA